MKIHTCLYIYIKKTLGYSRWTTTLTVHQRMFHVATYPDSYDSPRTYVMENAGSANAWFTKFWWMCPRNPHGGGCAPELRTEMRSEIFIPNLNMNDTNLNIEAIHTLLVTLTKLPMSYSKFSSLVHLMNTWTCFVCKCTVSYTHLTLPTICSV